MCNLIYMHASKEVKWNTTKHISFKMYWTEKLPAMNIFWKKNRIK